MELLRTKTASGNTESSELKNVRTVMKKDSLKIKNQRPKDYLEEREAYEQLCRQTEGNVKANFNAKTKQIRIFLFS